MRCTTAGATQFADELKRANHPAGAVSFTEMSSPVTEYHEEDALGKAYDSRLMRRLLRYARPYRSLVASSLGLLAVEGVLQLVGRLLTQRVIDVALPARNVIAAAQMATVFAGALALSFLASYGETLLTSLLGQRVMRDLRHELFAHLQALPIAFFDRNPVGRLITRVTSDVESLNELFTAGVVSEWNRSRWSRSACS